MRSGERGPGDRNPGQPAEVLPIAEAGMIRIRSIVRQLASVQRELFALGFPIAGARLAVVMEQIGRDVTDVIETVERIKAVLPRLQASIPPAIDLHIVSDRTQTIRASVDCSSAIWGRR
jgi:L-rhamnose isomerase